MRETDNGHKAAALERSDGMDQKTSLRIAVNLLILCFNCVIAVMKKPPPKKKTTHKQGCRDKGGCMSNNSATINRKINQNKNVTLLGFIANER